ncbi:MAG TPA: hypothetical protein VIH28_09825 [Ignavibacteriaceae bacterium]
MKSLIKYFLLLFLIGSFLGCNNPQPTALIEDNDPIEIEVLTKNPAEPTSFGIDSTGLNDNPARFTNVITVAGIKQTIRGISFKSSFAQAAFFDKTKPVFGINGKLIGYSTLTPGNVFFSNQKAERRQFRIRYGVNKDTSLGLRYVLHRRGILGDPFNFDFNSNINFRFVPDISSAVSFDIATPPEIFLNYRLAGSKSNKNLNLLLEWNAGNVKNFEILISIIDDPRNIVFPLYKIKTADDGKFVMPKKLLEELAARFDKLEFTLTRKFEKQQGTGIAELIVVSQSINSISVDIP